MGFLADGTEAHGTCDETFHDCLHRLHLFDRNGFILPERKKIAKEDRRLLTVHHLRVLFKFLVTAQAGSQLKGRDCLRIPGMFLTVFPKTVDPFVFEHFIHRTVECLFVQRNSIACYLFQPDTADVAGRPPEISTCHFRVQTDSFKQLGATITADRTDTHLAHDFKEPFTDRFYIILTGRFVVKLYLMLAFQLLQYGKNHVRIDSASPISQ